MRVAHTIAELRAILSAAPPPALVPTMGGLHQGHLSLVRIAKSLWRPVVGSIFVNRLQFAPHDDFDRYPRTLSRDIELLEAEGCDILFAPSESEMYPQPQSYLVRPPPELADKATSPFSAGTELLCALARPPFYELPGIRTATPHRFDVTPETEDGEFELGSVLDEALLEFVGFAHDGTPTIHEFERVTAEVSGQDLSWFFDQVPSLGLKGLYSWGGTLSSPASLCE